MKKQIEITEKTKQAIYEVACACAQDMEYAYASKAAIVAETALDANRLTTFGHPEADAEVGRLIDQHGYPAVLRVVKKFVPTM